MPSPHPFNGGLGSCSDRVGAQGGCSHVAGGCGSNLSPAARSPCRRRPRLRSPRSRRMAAGRSAARLRDAPPCRPRSWVRRCGRSATSSAGSPAPARQGLCGFPDPSLCMRLKPISAQVTGRGRGGGLGVLHLRLGGVVQQARRVGGDVDADLGHRLHGDRVDAVGRLRPGAVKGAQRTSEQSCTWLSPPKDDAKPAGQESIDPRLVAQRRLSRWPSIGVLWRRVRGCKPRSGSGPLAHGQHVGGG
jgi:hypothetical protein